VNKQAKIDLIIPGLFDLPSDELGTSFLQLELPALNHILRFGSSHATEAYDLESMLIQSMCWSGLQTLPFAQAYAKPESQDNNNILLCKAVHLKTDMHNMIVVPIEDNPNNRNDITIVINDLKELFKVDFHMQELQEGLWLMHLQQCTPARHYPHYLSVYGRKADPYVEQSRQALPWYKLINEMQMFMHQHSINQSRLESGLLPINSLWFWGAGDLPQSGNKNMRWFCDDELLKQFASVMGIYCADLDEVKNHDFEGDSVVIDLSILEALKLPGEVSLQSLLSDLESRLFEPLVAGIKSKRIALKLKTGSANDLILSRYSSIRRWKKTKSLLDFFRY